MWYTSLNHVAELWVIYGNDCPHSRELGRHMQDAYAALLPLVTWCGLHQGAQEVGADTWWRWPVYATPALRLVPTSQQHDEVWFYGEQCWQWLELVNGGGGGGSSSHPYLQMPAGRGAALTSPTMLRADRMPPVGVATDTPAVHRAPPAPSTRSGRRSLGTACDVAMDGSPAPLGGSAASWDGPAVNATLQRVMDEEGGSVGELVQGPGGDTDPDGRSPPPSVSVRKGQVGNTMERRLQEYTATREEFA